MHKAEANKDVILEKKIRIATNISEKWRNQKENKR